MSTAVHPNRFDGETPSVWREALRASLRVDWAGTEPLAALRCTIGVALPLGIALAAGQPGAGMFAAIGAVSAGFGSFQGAYRSRAAIMLFAVVGMALSLTVGSLAGHSSVTATLVTALWGLGTGLLVSLGQGASFVGLQSSVALIVAAAYPSPFGEAAGRGLLVFAGGLVQVVLVVSVWPLRRFSAERQFIARLYRSLAAYATTLATGDLLPPEPHTLAGTAPPDADPQPFARSSELLVFRGLYDEAERIRAALAALSLSPARADEMLAVHAVVLLRELAAAVDDGRAPERLDAHWRALEKRAAVLRAQGATVDSLVSQIRAAFRMANVPAPEDEPGDARSGRAPAFPSVRQAFVTLRANLSFRSTAFRHAVRLAVTLAAATALARGYALPRGYWFPMTALLVLKPEFRETFITGITRVIGTLAGAGLAALLVGMLGSDVHVVTALLLVFVWAGYSLFRASYTLFTVCITGYIVLLLYLVHAPGPATATYRAMDTMLGGVLALLVFRAWPTWEAWRAPEVVARQCEMLARYTAELLGTFVAPERWDPKRLAEARAAARLARSNSEASVERLLGEPVAPRDWRGRLGLGVLAAFRRYSLAALALHARLETGPPDPVPQLAPIRDCLVERLHALAAFMRTDQDVERLRAACSSDVPRPMLDRALSEQVDLLIESLDNVADLLMAVGES